MSVRRFLPAMLWWLVIAAASSIPAGTVSIGFWANHDKLAHFLIFSVLGFWLCHGFLGKSSMAKSFLFAMALGLAAGAVDEFYQSFIPGRDPSRWDWIADTSGVFFGAFLRNAFHWFSTAENVDTKCQ